VAWSKVKKVARLLNDKKLTHNARGTNPLAISRRRPSTEAPGVRCGAFPSVNALGARQGDRGFPSDAMAGSALLLASTAMVSVLMSVGAAQADCLSDGPYHIVCSGDVSEPARLVYFNSSTLPAQLEITTQNLTSTSTTSSNSNVFELYQSGDPSQNVNGQGISGADLAFIFNYPVSVSNFDIAAPNNIPVVLFSAGGSGSDGAHKSGEKAQTGDTGAAGGPGGAITLNIHNVSMKGLDQALVVESGGAQGGQGGTGDGEEGDGRGGIGGQGGNGNSITATLVNNSFTNTNSGTLSPWSAAAETVEPVVWGGPKETGSPARVGSAAKAVQAATSR